MVLWYAAAVWERMSAREHASTLTRVLPEVRLPIRSAERRPFHPRPSTIVPGIQPRSGSQPSSRTEDPHICFGVTRALK
jgi:hypothetical protein